MSPKIFHALRIPSLLLAAVLQFMPMVRAALPAMQSASNLLAIVFRWSAATTAALGSMQAVSGASTLITTTNFTATNGVATTNKLLTAPQVAGWWSASGLPPGIGLTGSGSSSKLAGIPTAAGVYTFTLIAWSSATAPTSERTTNYNCKFTVVVGGGGGASNSPPVANAQSVLTAEDTAKAITLTGTDADGNALTYAVVTAPAHGTLSGTAPSVIYTPTANYNGADSFTFRANDGTSNSAAATVSITVTAVNDAPVATPQSFATDKNVAKNLTLAGTDVDGNALAFIVVAPPTNGVLAGTAPNLTYTPNNNVTGADSFTFKANDGTVDSTPATVTITIATGPNTAPVAIPQNVTATEDIAAPITLTGTDADGNALTYAIVAMPAHGTLTGTAPNATYTPATNYNGSDSFTFRVNDGTSNSTPATVSITITAVNDAPLANAQAVSTLQNTAKAVTLTGSDVDGNALTYTVVTPPSKGTLSGTAPNLTYTPAANTNGTDSFTFRVSDGTTNSGTAIVSIAITAVNITPVANAQSVTTAEDMARAITLTGSDAEGSLLTYTVVTPPAKGTLSGTAPNLTYSPAANTNGSDSFTFRVNDGTSNSAPASITITITPVNDPPTLNSLSNVTLADNAGPQAVSLSGISAGAANEAQTPSVQATSSDPNIATITALNYTSPGSTGSLTLSPVTGANGTATITVAINDGGTSNNIVIRTFDVTVTSLALLPTIALTSPLANSSYIAPATLNLAAQVTTNGQTIQRVQFFADTNLVGEVTNAPYQLAWTCTSETGVVLVARAIYGAASSHVDSAPVALTHNPLPGAWEPSELGSNTVAGRVTVTNDTYFVEGAGLLSGSKDSFQYVHQPLLGDGSLTIRLASVTSSNRNARIGLMIRESVTPNSRYAFIGVSPDGYVRWQRRTITGVKASSSYYNPENGVPANVWLRLTRSSGTISGYRSINGVDWVRLSSVKISMAANVTMGFAVASGSTDQLDTTVFSNPIAVP